FRGISAEGFRRAGRDDGARLGHEARKRAQERAERTGELISSLVVAGRASISGRPSTSLRRRVGATLVVARGQDACDQQEGDHKGRPYKRMPAISAGMTI